MRPLLLALFVLTACQNEPVARTYKLAKDTRQQTRPSLSYTVPTSWNEQPASGMRAASFLADKVDISVVRLAGSAGGDLANVNRWRQQISLPAWSNAELNAQTSQQDTLLGKARLVSFANDTEQITAATIDYQGDSIFVKMHGPKAETEAQKTALNSFLRTICYR